MSDAANPTLPGGDRAHVVLAVFATVEAAAEASTELRRWDEADRDLRRGAFGIIRLVDGRPMTEVGSDEGRGRRTRALLTLLAGSGDPPRDGKERARRAWDGAGELVPEVVDRLHEDLAAGRVAVIVICDEYEHEATRTKLGLLGGDVEVFRVPDAALVRLAQVVTP